VTGVVTGFPLSQSPGALHAKDEAVGQSRGSKPVKRRTTSNKIKQTTIDPPIFNRSFNGYLRDGEQESFIRTRFGCIIPFFPRAGRTPDKLGSCGIWQIPSYRESRLSGTIQIDLARHLSHKLESDLNQLERLQWMRKGPLPPQVDVNFA
jgi:hypothetical protein